MRSRPVRPDNDAMARRCTSAKVSTGTKRLFNIESLVGIASSSRSNRYFWRNRNQTARPSTPRAVVARTACPAMNPHTPPAASTNIDPQVARYNAQCHHAPAAGRTGRTMKGIMKA
jgi:hypothetical protein